MLMNIYEWITIFAGYTMSEDNIQVITDVTEETELDKHEKQTWIQAQIDSHNIQREAGRCSIY